LRKEGNKRNVENLGNFMLKSGVGVVRKEEVDKVVGTMGRF
jgi:hypothetical protein